MDFQYRAICARDTFSLNAERNGKENGKTGKETGKSNQEQAKAELLRLLLQFRR